MYFPSWRMRKFVISNILLSTTVNPLYVHETKQWYSPKIFTMRGNRSASENERKFIKFKRAVILNT